jgi:hypothetical protein
MDIANIDRTRAALRRGFKIVECENALVGVNDEDRTVRPADDELFNSSRLPARTKFVVGFPWAIWAILRSFCSRIARYCVDRGRPSGALPMRVWRRLARVLNKFSTGSHSHRPLRQATIEVIDSTNMKMQKPPETEPKQIQVMPSQIARAITALRVALDFIDTKHIPDDVRAAKSTRIEAAREFLTVPVDRYDTSARIQGLGIVLIWAVNLITENYNGAMPAGLADGFVVLKQWGLTTAEGCPLPPLRQRFPFLTDVSFRSDGRGFETGTPNAARWRARSEETRTQAEQMINPETRSLMLGFADDYGRIAQIAEAMALIRKALDSALS